MDSRTVISDTARIEKAEEYFHAVPEATQRFKPTIRLLATCFDTYYAGIHLIDGQKQWIRASTWLGLSFMYLEDSICSHTLQNNRPLFIEDLGSDARTKDLFYVSNPPKLRSYLATPLYSPEEYPVGTVCVMDKEPREFRNEEIETLQHIADEVVDKFELHRENKQLDTENRRLETQLREIHHRLKNNLNLISGLLELERMQTSEHSFSEMLEGVKKRIKSIATLHQHLYESELLQNLDLKPYLEDLIDNILAGMSRENTTIDYTITGDQPRLPQHKIVYVGLLLNELLTNSLKHAFKGREKGSVQLDIKRQREKCILHYSDDGKGLPDHFELNDEDSLGCKLIQKFIDQLHGDIEFYNDDGTHFRISFPINVPELEL